MIISCDFSFQNREERRNDYRQMDSNLGGSRSSSVLPDLLSQVGCVLLLGMNP